VSKIVIPGFAGTPSCGGRFVLAFNGEISNCPELRAELERGDGLMSCRHCYGA